MLTAVSVSDSYSLIIVKKGSCVGYITSSLKTFLYSRSLPYPLIGADKIKSSENAT